MKLNYIIKSDSKYFSFIILIESIGFTVALNGLKCVGELIFWTLLLKRFIKTLEFAVVILNVMRTRIRKKPACCLKRILHCLVCNKFKTVLYPF